MDRLERRFLRLQGLHDDPISSDEDDAPSESLDMLESRLRQLQRRTALNRERSRAATRLQSRFRGNRIRTLKKRNRETLDRMKHNVEQMKRDPVVLERLSRMNRSPVKVKTRPLPASEFTRQNRETLDRMRHNVEQMKRDPYIDEFRSRFFAPNDSIIHQNTRHGDITELIVPYLAIVHRKRELSRLIDEFRTQNNRNPSGRNERWIAAQAYHMDFDSFIIKFSELPLDVKQIVIDSSISMNLDKSALELYDSSDEEEYDSDEEPNNFYIYLKELQIPDILYRLTQLIVDNLIESGNSELQAYRYTCDFVEFLIDNYH